MPRLIAPWFLLAGLAMCSFVDTALGATCPRSDARKIVDQTWARLRVYAAESQPKLQARLRVLKEKRGWTGDDGEAKVAEIVSDSHIADLDAKSANLLMRIDDLSESGSGETVDCSVIGALNSVTAELQATVRAKTQYLMGRVDSAIAGGDGKAKETAAVAPSRSPATEPAQPAPSKAAAPHSGGDAAKPAGQVAKNTPAAAAPDKAGTAAVGGNEDKGAGRELPRSAALLEGPDTPEGRPQLKPSTSPPAPPPKATKPAHHSKTSWATETVKRPPDIRRPQEPQAPAMPDAMAPRPRVSSAPLPPPEEPQVPVTQTRKEDSFSAEEIRQASRGFFGSISGGLAKVIEHAFSTLGRPTAYILGSEGGGAFIAGLRYGKGQLFMRDGSRREVYWHGPSIGYDVGAAGSKTMFLVYNLKNDLDIFTGYTGVDGSAYLVGGVGMTVLTNGNMVLAPIRSGLGLRFGASLSYVRFTARATWNPF
ncbi:MAG: EipA family protein [Hyphomicrobiaceae bacterium]